MEASFCQELLTAASCPTHVIQVHQTAEGNTRRAPNEPSGLLFLDNASSLLTIFLEREVPRLAIALERAQVKGFFPQDIEVAALVVGHLADAAGAVDFN